MANEARDRRRFLKLVVFVGTVALLAGAALLAALAGAGDTAADPGVTTRVRHDQEV